MDEMTVTVLRGSGEDSVDLDLSVERISVQQTFKGTNKGITVVMYVKKGCFDELIAASSDELTLLGETDWMHFDLPGMRMFSVEDPKAEDEPTRVTFDRWEG